MQTKTWRCARRQTADVVVAVERGFSLNTIPEIYHSLYIDCKYTFTNYVWRHVEPSDWDERTAGWLNRVDHPCLRPFLVCLWRKKEEARHFGKSQSCRDNKRRLKLGGASHCWPLCWEHTCTLGARLSMLFSQDFLESQQRDQI